MDFDLWWLLLLPVFFSLGWLAARIDMRTVLHQAKTIPTTFFRGLDALVEDKTDMAATVLAEVTRQNPAPELPFILGKLYRKRGENDRAIRLHQGMLDQADLASELKDTIRFELAQDFQKAGLVDRAEEILLTLLAGSMGLAARRQLLNIYQQDRDWEKAIAIARELRNDAHSFQHEVAQFYCEMAQGALYRSDYLQAAHFIHEAFSANRKCVRASLLLGDIESAQGNLDAAMTAWQNIEKQNYEYLSMVAERLFDAYERQGRPREGIALLRGYQKTFPQLELAELLYQKICTYEGETLALTVLREAVHARPSLLGVYRLIDAQMNSLSLSVRLDAELTRTLIAKHALQLTLHRCKCCHFRSHAFFWHCPACSEWESFTPSRTES